MTNVTNETQSVAETETEITTLKVDHRGRAIIPQPLRRRFGVDGIHALLRLHIRPRYNFNNDEEIIDKPEEIQTVEMDSRGRITIPKKVRERYDIADDDVLIQFELGVSKALDED